MKDVRPSTWVLLGVLTLFIFAPLLLLDIEPVQQTAPANGEPADPGVRPARKPGNDSTPQNSPSNGQPASNQPEAVPRENGLLD